MPCKTAKLFSLLLFCALVFWQVASAQAPAAQAKEKHILTIQQFMQQGDLAGARQSLTQAQKQFPADAGLDNLLGILEAQQNNFAAAETAFKRALTRSPKFIGAYLNLGRLYQENSANNADTANKALQTYQRVLQFQPQHIEANYQTAVLLQARGEYKTSLVHLSRLPVDYQQRAQILAVQCANYAALGEAAKASDTASILLAHAELTEADVLAILPVLEKSRRNELIINLLNGLAQRNLALAASLYQLGLAYERSGDLTQARIRLEQAAKLEPSAKLLFDLARVSHLQKDLQGALGYLAHARDIAPTESILSYYFGQICIELNLVAEAHKALLQAVTLEPNNAEYNYALGIVSTWRHDPSEAIPYLQKYLSLKPADARGQLALGATHFKVKDFDAARKELTEAAKNKATASEAHYYLGRLARQENKLDEAIQELNLTLTTLPNHVDALAELGLCQTLRKEFSQAEQTLVRALQIDADHYAANFNLLMLYGRTKDAREAEQTKRFAAVRQRREERSQDMLRIIETKSNGEK